MNTWLIGDKVIKIHDIPEEELYESIINYETTIKIDNKMYESALSGIDFWTISYVYIGEFECILAKQFYNIKPKILVKYVGGDTDKYCGNVKTLSDLNKLLFYKGPKSARKVI